MTVQSSLSDKISAGNQLHRYTTPHHTTPGTAHIMYKPIVSVDR